MARTKVTFKDTNSNLFVVCDEWAQHYKFKTVESTDSSRLYRKRQLPITPLLVFLPSRHMVKISLSSGTITIECWTSFLNTETEVSSEHFYQFLSKDIFRAHVNDLLTQLGQSDNLIQ